MAKQASEGKLTPRQERFCQAMASGADSGTAAAIIAGYSESSAHVQAHENIKNPKIISRIAELGKDALAGHGVTADKIIGMLLESAQSKDIADGARVRAMELLGKTLAMFKDVHIDETEEMDEESLVAAVLGDYDLAATLAKAMAADSQLRPVMKEALEKTMIEAPGAMLQ